MEFLGRFRATQATLISPRYQFQPLISRGRHLGLDECLHPRDPVISSVSRDSGAPGDIVTIQGRNFIGVRFNGVDAQWTAMGGSILSAEVPEEATSGPITVITEWGQTSTREAFTVLAEDSRPVITELSLVQLHVAKLGLDDRPGNLILALCRGNNPCRSRDWLVSWTRACQAEDFSYSRKPAAKIKLSRSR